MVNGLFMSRVCQDTTWVVPGSTINSEKFLIYSLLDFSVEFPTFTSVKKKCLGSTSLSLLLKEGDLVSEGDTDYLLDVKLSRTHVFRSGTGKLWTLVWCCPSFVPTTLSPVFKLLMLKHCCIYGRICTHPIYNIRTQICVYISKSHLVLHVVERL